jgi:hypothetical protein
MKAGNFMNSKAKLISVLAFSFVSLALITTPAAMQQDPQQPAHNPQHQTQNQPQAQPTPTPHPSPHTTPHPTAEPTVDPRAQPSPHPSPYPSLHPANDPSPVPGPVPAEVDMDRVKVKLPWPPPDAMMVDPQAIRTNKRPAIPFRPFELIDPKTNKPVPLDTLISPGEGRTMSAGEYYEEVNRVEKQLNQIGYSLRNPEAAPIQLQDVIVGNLQTQPGGDTELRRAQEGANKPARDMSPEEIKKEAIRLGVDAERETVLSSGNFGKPKPGERIATINKSLPWSYTWGDPRVFSTSLNGGIQLVGTPNGTGVTETVTATGTLFGNNVPVLMSVNNRLDTPLTGPMSATMSIMVFGQTVYSRNYTPTALWSWQDRWVSAVDYQTPYIRIYANGPDFLDARFEITGLVGASFDNSLNRGMVFANIVPIVKTQARVLAISWSVGGSNGGGGAEATGCPLSPAPSSGPFGDLFNNPKVISGSSSGAACLGGPNGLSGVNPIGNGSDFGSGLRNEKFCYGSAIGGGPLWCPTCRLCLEQSL